MFVMSVTGPLLCISISKLKLCCTSKGAFLCFLTMSGTARGKAKCRTLCVAACYATQALLFAYKLNRKCWFASLTRQGEVHPDMSAPLPAGEDELQ